MNVREIRLAREQRERKDRGGLTALNTMLLFPLRYSVNKLERPEQCFTTELVRDE